MRIGLAPFARSKALRFSARAAGLWNTRFGDTRADLPALGSAAGLSHYIEANIIAERDRWFPWTVIGFVCGCLAYYALKTEPTIVFSGMLACAGVAIARSAIVSDGPGRRFLCTIIAASCIGFSIAKLRTEIVDAPIITSDTVPLRLEGRIESVFVQDDTHARILLAPSLMGRESVGIPRRVRLSLRGERCKRSGVGRAGLSTCYFAPSA